MSPTLGAVQRLLAKRRGLTALTGREILRVLKLWTQTVGAPVVSSFLFILVFGLSLGGRITSIDGVEYEVFIVPGLITMAMVQAAYANNSASVFQAKFDRYLNDILAAPMRAWEVNLGLSLGGVVRALLIGGALLVLVAARRRRAGARAAASCCSPSRSRSSLFSSLGVVVGIYAESWDHTAFVNNLVILPLTFLGGVFYSVDVLPSPWEELSHVNPIFFLVQAVRYGFLGTSDVSVGLALARDRRARGDLRRLVDLAVRDRPEDQAVAHRPGPAARAGPRGDHDRSSSARRSPRRSSTTSARRALRCCASASRRRPARGLAPALARAHARATCGSPRRSGSSLGVMNLTFYEALDRIPLGIAVTIEFVGPLARRGARARAAGSTCCGWCSPRRGSSLLADPGGGDVDTVGVLFALVAACAGRSTSSSPRAPGSGSAAARAWRWRWRVAALVPLVPGDRVRRQRAARRPRSSRSASCVALLSSVIPYSLETEALRRMPKNVFGVLMSLEPAVAALAGFLVLGQELGAARARRDRARRRGQRGRDALRAAAARARRSP